MRGHVVTEHDLHRSKRRFDSQIALHLHHLSDFVKHLQNSIRFHCKLVLLKTYHSLGKRPSLLFQILSAYQQRVYVFDGEKSNIAIIKLLV